MHVRIFNRIFLYLVVAVVFWILGSSPGVIADQEYALTLYGGYMTKEVWFNTISHDTVFAHANIVVVAAAWTFSQWWHGKLTWELEGQVGKYFGAQENWEFNLPILSFRWHPFPWDPLLDTSFAWGIGLSYATREPEVEIDISDETSQWLIHWHGEVTFGPPAASWEVLFRLHHRSGGFGLVADKGGSNTLCAGLRYRF